MHTSMAPCLPGFEPPEAPPSAAAPSARRAPRVAPRTPPPEPPRTFAALFKANLPLTACAALALALITFVGVATYKFLSPRVVVQEVVREIPDALPLALLPDSADPALWSTVASMSGTIGKTELAFHHGIAYSNGIEYKVCLDFCQSGDFIYARVKGASAWVVKVNAKGRIVKSYPARNISKPLREIF